jgi:hypothetical protein
LGEKLSKDRKRKGKRSRKRRKKKDMVKSGKNFCKQGKKERSVGCAGKY